jgi:flap endonuclease-1
MCECILLDEVLSTVKLTHMQFVDFCLLCGNDYLDRIRLIGFKKALALIQKCKTIDAALIELSKKRKDLDKFELSNKEIVDEVRNYFIGKLDIKFDNVPVVFYQKGLETFLSENIVGFNRTRMSNKLPVTIRALKDFNEMFAGMQKFVLVLKESPDEQHI